MDDALLIRIFAGAFVLSAVLGSVALTFGIRARAGHPIPAKSRGQLFGLLVAAGILIAFLGVLPIWALVPLALIEGVVGYGIASSGLIERITVRSAR